MRELFEQQEKLREKKLSVIMSQGSADDFEDDSEMESNFGDDPETSG